MNFISSPWMLVDLLLHIAVQKNHDSMFAHKHLNQNLSKSTGLFQLWKINPSFCVYYIAIPMTQKGDLTRSAVIAET